MTPVTMRRQVMGADPRERLQGRIGRPTSLKSTLACQTKQGDVLALAAEAVPRARLVGQSALLLEGAKSPNSPFFLLHRGTPLQARTARVRHRTGSFQFSC